MSQNSKNLPFRIGFFFFFGAFLTVGLCSFLAYILSLPPEAFK